MNQPVWSSAKKFSFVFFLFFLPSWPLPWNWVPYLNELIGDYGYYPSFFVQNYLLKMHTPLLSGNMLRQEAAIPIDDWILMFTWLAVAVIGCIIWSYFDRKRENYVTLNYWFRVTLRYYPRSGCYLLTALTKSSPCKCRFRH